MMYVAIELGPDGGMRQHPKTAEYRTIEIGEFDNKTDAVSNACHQLNCRQIFRGVIRRLKGSGGYVVLDSQGYAQV
jgi:hypothetical protein